METIDKRIKQLVDVYANGNVQKFAQKFGYSEANIRNYLRGTLPKYDTLYDFVTILKVSAHWLITGEGDMTSKETATRNVFEQSFELMMMNQVLQEKNKMIKEKERVIQVLLEKYNAKVFGTELNNEIAKSTFDDKDSFLDKRIKILEENQP